MLISSTNYHTPQKPCHAVSKGPAHKKKRNIHKSDRFEVARGVILANVHIKAALHFAFLRRRRSNSLPTPYYARLRATRKKRVRLHASPPVAFYYFNLE